MEYNAAMAKSLDEFLQSKGGVGLLTVLQNRGKTYSEIEPNVLITSSTISTRLDDALDLGLIEITPARRHGRTLNEYHLTDFGEAVVRELAMRGIVSNYRDMRTHHQSMEEKTEEFSEWFRDNPGEFVGFEEAHEETLIKRDSEELESGTSDSGVPDSEDMTSKVIRPDEEGQSSEAGNDDSEKDSEGETTESDDANQHQLSDTDMRERMEQHAVNTDDDEKE